MAVQTNTQKLTRAQALVWVEDRGIQRLPAAGEQLEYVPPGRYDQFNMVRSGDGFSLTSHILTSPPNTCGKAPQES